MDGRFSNRRDSKETPSLADQAAQFLVEKQWPIVPSRGPQKRPCVAWKRFQQQLPTVDELRQWSREFSPERWGLVTGALAGIVVVDFDGDQGRSLMQQWSINPHIRTGSGGFHWYGLHPGWHVPTLNAKSGKVSWPWPGVDIRGDGGFAVLLGKNANGSYVQLRDLIPEPFDVLPSEVRMFLRNHGEANSNQTRMTPARLLAGAIGNPVDRERLIEKALGIAAEAGRNNAGFWLACQLRDDGDSFGGATAAMRAYRSRVASANTKGQVEPYAENEMMASLMEAFSRPARDPWERQKPHPHDGLCLVTASPAEPGVPDKSDSSFGTEKPEQQPIADDRENLYLHVGQTAEPLVGHTGDPVSLPRFARIPLEVLTDPRLSPRDVRVYGVLALSCWAGACPRLGNCGLRLRPIAQND